MAMVKTPIEIDQDALEIAAEVLGTTTKKDTVNAALREVGQRHRGDAQPGRVPSRRGGEARGRHAVLPPDQIPTRAGRSGKGCGWAFLAGMSKIAFGILRVCWIVTFPVNTAGQDLPSRKYGMIPVTLHHGPSWVAPDHHQLMAPHPAGPRSIFPWL
jgi:Bacterial antitoxin of type II TA system, VapB